MDQLAQIAIATLQRFPAPSMSIEELYDALRREAHDVAPAREHVVRALEGQPGLRILHRPPSEGEIEIGPTAWVVASGSDRRPERHIRSLSERLRQTLVTLAGIVDADSLRDWARWNRMLVEGDRIRAALLGAPAPERPPTPPMQARPARRRRRARAATVKR